MPFCHAEPRATPLTLPIEKLHALARYYFTLIGRFRFHDVDTSHTASATWALLDTIFVDIAISFDLSRYLLSPIFADSGIYSRLSAIARLSSRRMRA